MKNRNYYVYAAVILVVSAAFRLLALGHDVQAHADTLAFLDATRWMAGSYHGTEIPFRLSYPLYPALAWLILKFSHVSLPDAARFAALLPAIATPVVVAVIGWLAFENNRFIGFVAGILSACAPNLIYQSVIPLYDSLFIFMTALALLMGVLIMKRPTFVMVALAGIVAGLAWLTRGPGMFYAIPLMAMLWMVARSKFWRLGTILVGLFLIAGYLPKIVVTKVATAQGLRDMNHACTKQLVLDGIWYAKGSDARNTIAYTPEGSAEEDRVCQIGWMEFAREYRTQYVRALAANGAHLLYETLTAALSPFIILAIPIGLGMFWFGIEKKLGILLGLFTVPFVTIIPAIQLQERYLYPLLIIVELLAAAGLFMLFSNGKRGLVTVALAMFLLVGVHSAYIARNEPPATRNYKLAAQWIGQRLPDVTVAAKAPEFGMYSDKRVTLIAGDADAVRRNLIKAGAQYAIIGPSERQLNPGLSGKEGSLVATFGKGNDQVLVTRVADTPDE